MNNASTDVYYLIEMLLICAIPFALMAAGIIMRRKFKPAAGGPPVPDAAGKTGRFIGTFLLWAGILALLFCAIVLLNYRGVL